MALLQKMAMTAWRWQLGNSYMRYCRHVPLCKAEHLWTWSLPICVVIARDIAGEMAGSLADCRQTWAAVREDLSQAKKTSISPLDLCSCCSYQPCTSHEASLLLAVQLVWVKDRLQIMSWQWQQTGKGSDNPLCLTKLIYSYPSLPYCWATGRRGVG